MGQSLNKSGNHLATGISRIVPAHKNTPVYNSWCAGSEEKEKEIEPVILNHYDKYFSNTKDWNYADFYHAVCQIVE